MNIVILKGNVGQDPKITNFPEGGKVAQFTLATTERFRDRSGELRENTEWHNIVAWRNNADVAEKYIRRGTQLYIEGRIRTRSWTDQTGNKRYTTEITVDNLQLLGKRADNPGAQQGGDPLPTQSQAAPSYQQPAPAPVVRNTPAPTTSADISLDNPEDDLPF
jgi:single-strand DNA-binding protein